MMPTITFDVVPFCAAVLALIWSIYMNGEDSGLGTGWVHVLVSVFCTVVAYVLFVGVIALGGG